MEDNRNLNKKLSIGVISLFLFSLIGNIIFFTNHANLKSERDATELKMDSLLSVKLLVDKELNQAKIDIEAYKGKNAQLDNALTDLDSRLSESKLQVEKLVLDNASVNSLKKKLKESQKLRDDCEKVINEYIKEIEKLKTQNNNLNKSINTLSQDLENLKTKLELGKAIRAYEIIIANYKVTKRSNKATTKARKVNRISAMFELAANPIAEPGLKEVHMVVRDSKGGIVGPQNKKFTNKTEMREQVYSASRSLEYKNNDTQMTINFDTDIKLKKDTYTVEIYVDGFYSGKKNFILK